MRAPPAFVIAAPSSGSGKTTVTLGLLRAFREAGLAVASAKIGPDYIDPRFHEAASGRPCPNLDGWAMGPARLRQLADGDDPADLLVVEGVMGLFDRPAEPGANGQAGGTAEIAALLGWPVVLVIDGSGMAQSAGAIADGFARRDPRLTVAGVILNRVASPRHEALLRQGCAEAGIKVLGAAPRRPGLATPARHLGLVQASERPDLEAFLDAAAAIMAAHVDLDALRALARRRTPGDAGVRASVTPPGGRIAIARDDAFRFAYPHMLADWRKAGADIGFFSPLGDEAPDEGCDAVFLPGGYPELHAGRLAAAGRFMDGLRDAADRGVAIYGECGGYMTLGDGVVDADGARHAMAGLLRLETSFAARKLHLGYRRPHLAAASALGAAGDAFRAHEFHYATVTAEAGEPLFRLPDGGTAGLVAGTVSGSFLHVIEPG